MSSPSSPGGIFREPVIGSAPDVPLLCTPRWLIWPEEHNYEQHSRTKFKIKNMDSHTNIFCLKVKHQLMMFSCGYGILAPGEEKTIEMYLLQCEDWPKDGLDFYNMPIKIAVENLRMATPMDTSNMRDIEKKIFAREVFRRTSQDNPHQRMYDKMTVYLEKKEDFELIPVKTIKKNYEVC